MKKERLLVSFSGGRTSAFMTKWLLDNWRDTHEMVVVFANTGKEREETLQFVKACDDNWGFKTVWIETVMNEYGRGASFKVVNFETAARKGEPFEAVIAKHGIPNQSTPHCTRELKRNPIKAFMRSILWSDYYTAIGYRSDEPKRVNRKKQKHEKQLYPLFDDFPVTKEWINSFWENQSFNLQLKNYEGNCDLCWKKNLKKHLTIIQENPQRLEWWSEMEKKYEYYTPASRAHNEKIKPPHRFFRNNQSCQDLLSKSQRYFEAATDDVAKETYRQLLLYSNVGIDERYERGCGESCEPF